MGQPGIQLGAALQANNFEWWVQRFEAIFAYVDVTRIDHFRGFDAYWAVKHGQETAMEGEWIKAPGTALFEVINEKFGNLPIIAEDLGVITPEVEALRDRFEFPGMKILQFAFGAGTGRSFFAFQLRSQLRSLHRHSRQRHDCRMVQSTATLRKR